VSLSPPRPAPVTDIPLTTDTLTTDTLTTDTLTTAVLPAPTTVTPAARVLGRTAAAPPATAPTATSAGGPDIGALFDSTPWPMVVCDHAGSIHRANPMAQERLGAVEGSPLLPLLRPVDADLHAAFGDVAGTGTPTELAAVTLVGWAAQVHLHPLERGRWIVATIRPSVEGTHRASELRAHEDRFRALCEHAPAGILCAESGMRVDYVNDQCAELFGLDPEDLWGFGWLGGLAEGADVEAASAAVEAALTGEVVAPMTLSLRRPDGSLRRIEARFAPNGRGGGFVATIADVTEAHSLAELLEHQARHDELTGLGNRRLMLEEITGTIDGIRRDAAKHAGLVFIDLDNFKLVNDTLGHGVGDVLLTEVAERLVQVVRPVDTVTRFGGDEFVLLLRESADAAEAVAGRVVEAVSAPYLIDDHPVNVTASAGIVVITGDASAEHVLRDADVAMYQAKRGGKNRAARFSPEALVAAESHVTILNALRVTLESRPDRISVVYQPICALDGRVIGLEALARWTDPDLGEVPPATFIEVAETSGYADRIGELVRGTAIDAVALWRSQGWDGYLSVNVSAEELANDQLVDQLASQIELSGLDADALCAEVTETAVMTDREAARRVLDDIAALGVSIAIDDFGTGYSSLAYLKRFPVSVLKMDREFVAGVMEPGEDLAICSAIVAMAGALGLRVTAEGVETEGQLAALRELGVDAAQGWFFSRPATAADVPALLGLGAARPVTD